ncbi:hypothetical protein [Diplocloster hominis]|uniref:hypothetical protein n=1 Tax=Diplocloster hominis TaxID=3079010 RepID=UPI0031BB97DE
MVNEEKIRLMTKLAIYEENDGKKEIPLASYFQSDYISYNVIKTAIFVTIAYAIILGLWAVCNMDYVLANLNPDQLIVMIEKIVIIYVAVMLVYLICSYILYRIRYKQARKDLKDYYRLLKELNAFYSKEEQKTGRQERSGGQLYDDHITGI